jgi:hypothetical protein
MTNTRLFILNIPMMKGFFHQFKTWNYIARIKVDENENGIWDEADFANNILAEPIYIYDKQ